MNKIKGIKKAEEDVWNNQQRNEKLMFQNNGTSDEDLSLNGDTEAITQNNNNNNYYYYYPFSCYFPKYTT